jgi:hypothetical protein
MTSSSRPPGLIQRYREELQVRHYARRTVNTYEQWLRRFLRFHAMRHPRATITSKHRRQVALEALTILRQHLDSTPVHWILTHLGKLWTTRVQGARLALIVSGNHFDR